MDIDDATGDALLRICAAPDDDHGERLAGLDAGQWAVLAQVAWDKRVDPLLQRSVALSEMAGRVPAPAAQALDASVKWRALYRLRQGIGLSRLLGVLQQGGFDPVLLKGLPLAYRDYPEPALRPLRDVDLLVPVDEAVAAQELVLAQPGYRLAPWAGRYGIEHGHQLPELQDIELDLTIEIHHRLNPRNWGQEEQLLRKIRAEAETIPLLGRQVRVASTEANLLHLVEHATLHNCFENGPLVLSDIHFMARRTAIDWRSVSEQAESMGLGNALRLVALLAHDLGARWMPDWLVEAAAGARPLVAAAKQALLQDRQAALRSNLLLRLNPEGNRSSGWRVALGRAFRPDPYELAKIVKSESRSPLRWLGYPAWLVQRGSLYVGALRSRESARAAARQAQLLEWLGTAARSGPNPSASNK